MLETIITFLIGGGLVAIFNFVLNLRKQRQREVDADRGYVQDLQNRVLEFNNNVMKQNVELHRIVSALTDELRVTNQKLEQAQLHITELEEAQRRTETLLKQCPTVCKLKEVV